MPRLEGKTAIVTGASRGIGAEISKLFAAEGARVVCAARTVNEGDHPLEGSLSKTIADIKEAGGEATAVAANISLPEDCERLVEETRSIYGPVDVLVNNAALTYYLPVKDFPINRWMRSWAVNFHAPFILSQLVLGDMIERRSGSIVNISSGSAVGPGRGPYTTPPNNGTCYGAEKAASGTVLPGIGPGSVRVRDFGHCRIAIAGGADAGHRFSPPGRRDGRPSGRAAGIAGEGHLTVGIGADRQSDRPRLLQPANPAGIRLDYRRTRLGC